MKERRSLLEGMTLQQDNRVDRNVEEKFVRSGQATAAEPVAADQEPTPSPNPPAIRQNARKMSRLPLSTRIRVDYAAALKRASLERQLNGTTPNTLQDILEEALEPWLVANGYLVKSPPRR